jgi:hypothetical protein
LGVGQTDNNERIYKGIDSKFPPKLGFGQIGHEFSYQFEFTEFFESLFSLQHHPIEQHKEKGYGQ